MDIEVKMKTCFAKEARDYYKAHQIKNKQTFAKDKGVRMDVVLFTKAYNRNGKYFEISDLMKWVNKLRAILFNFNHDLSLSGGKYLGNLTFLSKIWAEYTNEGIEVWGTIESTDPEVLAVKNDITGVSIEIDWYKKDVIFGEDGRIFTIEFEWTGVAFLLGVEAGSGGSRIDNITTFAKDINTMDKEEDKKIVTNEEENKETSKFDKVKSESSSTTVGKEMFTDEEGKKFLYEWKSAWESKLTEITDTLTTSFAKLQEQVNELVKEKSDFKKEDDNDKVDGLDKARENFQNQVKSNSTFAKVNDSVENQNIDLNAI